MTKTETVTVPPELRNSTIGVFSSQADAEAAIRGLERGGFDMTQLSLLARGMSEERHVIGTETAGKRAGRWAGFGGAWGLLVGSFWWVPGVGHVAVGGYLLWLLGTTVLGAASGALGAALTATGIPEEGVLRYETDLRADRWLLIAHGTAADVHRARELMENTAPIRVDTHTAEPAEA